MKTIDILNELNQLSLNDSIMKKDLMEILKTYAGMVSVYDLMLASAYIRNDGRYIQGQYRENYIETYIKQFIIRMNEVSESNNYGRDEMIDKKEFIDALPRIEKTLKKDMEGAPKDKKLQLIYAIISLYTTFVLEEPIHPVGSLFPGNKRIEKIDGEYFCPVKDNQKDNEDAVCHLCIAKQSPDV